MVGATPRESCPPRPICLRLGGYDQTEAGIEAAIRAGVSFPVNHMVPPQGERAAQSKLLSYTVVHKEGWG